MYLVEIRSITKLPGNIEDLIHESEKEGFTFISRLKTEWEKAENRFNDIGEFLLSASYADHTWVFAVSVSIPIYQIKALPDSGICMFHQFIGLAL